MQVVDGGDDPVAGSRPRVHVEARERATIVAIDGEHDVASADAVREGVDEALVRGKSVVIDFSRATFIDTSIIGVLIGAIKRARAAGLELAIVLPPAPSTVGRIFAVGGLLSIAPVAASREEAIRRVGGPRDEGA